MQSSLSGTLFLSKLITQYAHLHERTVGKHAEEYIRQLGIRTGEWIETFYSEKSEKWSVDRYAQVIVDIKNSIGGHFRISEVHPDRVIVKAEGCPFGEVVKDAPHLCMMTSSVFGGIAARRMGYGKVNLRKRIAKGDAGCEVAIYFQPTDEEEGVVYENLPITPDNGNPFIWDEEAVEALGEELRKSDEMVVKLLDELESLKQEVDTLRSQTNIRT
ncbi:methanogen output domain 1-containing protein [Halobacillus sp. BBL2006]|uniref:methanogen output domain 1-containing protein n=1 Tax=Halobacillus sp. BBL2006 TaxID=1543706 RepID=UPI00054256C3|nr:methanogen output domain 1-containing protein [Halobacillus sp. BBL2006]KHE67153.1 sigma-54 dependent transcriptional regulator [Halobacillus sp. BBL2006]